MRAFPGRDLMKKAIGVLGVLCMAFAGGYFALGKWTIKHETLNFFDAKRHRSVAVNLAVRWDCEMKAGAGYGKLSLAIISQGNTVLEIPSILSWLMCLQQGAIWLPAYSMIFQPMRH
jgi:hypothetical protein